MTPGAGLTACSRCFWIAGTSPAVSGWSRVWQVGTSTRSADRWIGQPVQARRHAQHDVQLHRGITTADQRRMLAFPPRSRSCSDVEPPGESHSAFLPLCRIQGRRLIRRFKVQPSSSTATWFHHQYPSANYQKVLWFQGSTFSSCSSPRCQTTCPNSNPRPLSLICLGRLDRIPAVLNRRLD